jgi:hypothetical protein
VKLWRLLIDEIKEAVHYFLRQVLKHEVLWNVVFAFIVLLDEGLDFFLAIRCWD